MGDEGLRMGVAPPPQAWSPRSGLGLGLGPRLGPGLAVRLWLRLRLRLLASGGSGPGGMSELGRAAWGKGGCRGRCFGLARTDPPPSPSDDEDELRYHDMFGDGRWKRGGEHEKKVISREGKERKGRKGKERKRTRDHWAREARPQDWPQN